MSEIKKCYKEPRRRGIIYMKQKRKNSNWVGHILGRNCLLKHITEVKKEGRINVTGRRGRSMKLLDDIKEKRGY